MNGTITADAGKIKLEYLWPKIKSLVCRNGGFIDFGAPSDTNPQGTIINPKATIDIDGTSTIKVPTGLTLTVRTLRINGVELPVGTYNQFSSDVGRYFNSFGTGSIQVTGAPGFKVLIK